MFKSKHQSTHSPFFQSCVQIQDLPADLLNCEIGACGQSSEVSTFPLYVLSTTVYRIEIAGKLNICTLKDAIKTVEGIPRELQLLTHNGKLIKPSNVKNIQPGDNVHLIVRGRGGAKGKKSGKHSASKQPQEDKKKRKC